MEVFVKVWSGDDLVGFLKFPDEEILGENSDFFDNMFDYGFRIEKSTAEEYYSFQGGDEIDVESLRRGDYYIDDNELD